MGCHTCKTETCSGCGEKALSINDVCNPIECPTSECPESFDANCTFYTGEDITCGDIVVVSQGTSVAQAIANVTAYFCSAAVPNYTTIYPCLFSQSGTSAPTVEIPTGANTLGSIVWTYSGVGVFHGTLSGAFAGIVIANMTLGEFGTPPAGMVQISKSTDSLIVVRTFDDTGTASNSIARKANLEIKVYPV